MSEPSFRTPDTRARKTVTLVGGPADGRRFDVLADMRYVDVPDYDLVSGRGETTIGYNVVRYQLFTLRGRDNEHTLFTCIENPDEVIARLIECYQHTPKVKL